MNCYLLAGGESRRMGRSKVELFGSAAVALSRTAFDSVIAVQRPGSAPIPGVRAIYDVTAETPDGDRAGAAILAVLAALRDAGEPCFVIAVDYPLLTSDVLRFLRRRFEMSGAPLLVPEWQGRPQMLCAGYRVAMREAVEAAVAERRYALHPLLELPGVEIIAEQELRARFPGEPLMNVNTPAELREAESIHGRS